MQTQTGKEACPRKNMKKSFTLTLLWVSISKLQGIKHSSLEITNEYFDSFYMIFIKSKQQGNIDYKENPSMRLRSYSVILETEQSTNGSKSTTLSSQSQSQYSQMETSAFHKLGKQSDICLNSTGLSKAEVNFACLSGSDEWTS